MINNNKKLIDKNKIEEEEEKFNCDICNDSGVIEHGYWEEENDEFIVTKYVTCECSLD